MSTESVDLGLAGAPPPRSLIVGASGFVGRHFLTAYRAADPATLATSHRDPSLLPLDLAAADAPSWDPETLGCEAALLLAGATKIAQCERDPEATRRANVVGTLALAEHLLRAGLSIVFFSSDYVFAGDDGAYSDVAPRAPSTEYGRQKLEVEQRLLERHPDHVLVARLSRTYGLERGDGTLFDEAAATLSAGGLVRAAWDQVFSPTWVGDVVRAVAALQRAGARGVVNVCAPVARSRYDLLLELANALGVDPDRVERVALSELGLVGNRPLDTSLAPVRLVSLAPLEFTTPEEAIRVIAEQYR